jgi:hypothetical protein
MGACEEEQSSDALSGSDGLFNVRLTPELSSIRRTDAKTASIRRRPKSAALPRRRADGTRDVPFRKGGLMGRTTKSRDSKFWMEESPPGPTRPRIASANGNIPRNRRDTRWANRSQ